MTVERPSPKRPVTPPKLPLPPGAIDTHSHVFGPFDRFPLMPGSPYEPPLAPAEEYLEMLDCAGFAGGIAVHASANGWDNRTTLHAVAAARQRIKAIGVLAPTSTEAEYEAAQRAGMIGLRFTENGRAQPPMGVLLLADLQRLAPRLRARGWQTQVWATGDRVMAAAAMLRDSGLRTVFDHMGFFDPDQGATHPLFRGFVSMMRDGDFWVKLTPNRVSRQPLSAGHADVRPFHDALLAVVPERCLFGSDWPYIGPDAIDVGHMVDLFDAWTPDRALRDRILSDNARQCYGY